MERPLAAASWPAFMHRAAAVFIIKYTVMIDDFHLNYAAGYPPVFILNICTAHCKFIDHPLLVLLIQRNRRFTLAAVPAAAADEYIGKESFLFCFFGLLAHFDLDKQ
jgi:hypothetical protein